MNSYNKALKILSYLSIIIGVLILIYPSISQDYFIAKNPINNSIFEIFRSHGFKSPLILTWAFEGMRKISVFPRILLILLLIYIPLLNIKLSEKQKKYT